tara:strand:+ start:331 stop:504 length:174 start_codon:yes stop_codon:yes gene_type:complete
MNSLGMIHADLDYETAEDREAEALAAAYSDNEETEEEANARHEMKFIVAWKNGTPLL